jgi:hypothetical protein
MGPPCASPGLFLSSPNGRAAPAEKKSSSEEVEGFGDSSRPNTRFTAAAARACCMTDGDRSSLPRVFELEKFELLNFRINFICLI